ncbi:MAG: valine--tRNA ligase [bacterium]|nr:valine--tRNA ligase [bacterium]
MDAKYQHQLYETKINQLWQDAQAFTPAVKKPNAAPFTIVLPPPNANDPLHIGHAMYTVEDVLIRFHRMLGDDTLWLPGADHAGIETQFVFEKKLQKKGQSRFQFDRDTLYQMIWDYVQENADVAREQLKRLGFSLDWSRFKFTLDPDIVKTVLNTFQHLQEEGLVYRDLKLVNYCPKCGTAFSDLEVKHVTKKTPLYYIKYGPFVLATTRPETKFGDTAVAVHPEDKRYQHLVGQEIEVQGVNGPFKVKVIADEYVDREFGTGVVKITPAHDHHDYEVWQRHKDEIAGPKQVIDFNGRMTAAAGEFAGLKVAVAREKIVEKMQQLGLIDHIDYDYETQISSCYRCGATLEPLPLAQFFIKTQPLVKPIIEKLDAGEIKIDGPGYDKILRHWLTNLRDWNISRQIVWGIRMPVWYDAKINPSIQATFLLEKGQLKTEQPERYQVKLITEDKALISGKLGEILADYPLSLIKNGLQTLDAPIETKFVVSQTEPGENCIQETDTFDTWFSSSQWPFATLKNTQVGDFERFYPTSLMETGYDILPFWVMRMLMMGYFETQKLPFSRIYLHGLVRDQKGLKMSKSKGNVIDPLTIVEKYGADALRFALLVRSSAGLDKSVGENDFKAARNLTNKLWNAARFVKEFTADKNQSESSAARDQEFTNKMQGIVDEITQALGDYKVGLAADLLYDYFWHFFCDQAIEECKKGELSPVLLKEGLFTFLKLWQPFLPYVTEQIWQEFATINTDEKVLALAAWPTIFAGAHTLGKISN